MNNTRKLVVYTQFFNLIFLIGIGSVFGCGLLPQGEVTAMTFTASGFTLPVEMVYTEATPVRIAFTSISHSKDAAMRVVRDLIMDAVIDVLEDQARKAFLPYAVISQVLQQLNISIDYTPLECPTATDKPTNNNPILAMKGGCFIIGNLVTSMCLMDMMVPGGGQPNMPGCTLMPILNVEPINMKHKSIKGRLRTSNVIMANWSRQMWQSILNRVYQRLASGRFGKHFSTAVVIVDS